MNLEQIIRQLQDMTYLSWAKARNSSGTAGSFLKAYDENASGKTYYKLSNYDAWAGIIGHECVNEIKKFEKEIFNFDLNDEELLYLMLHINRMISR